MLGDDEDGEKSPPTTKVQINELLCFMQNIIGTIFAPTLTGLCSEKFKVEEIKAARDLLYKDLITDNRKPEFGKTHLKYSNFYKSMAHVSMCLNMLQ